ncbi:post-PEP-CTERM-1 domain-containing protein [Massilia sp. 9096]|uniref:post-PEP-CTERM-1 domain-containing protein n=1 Tax=Massilia sp. 9096 TaxID=1500894 RepID=UPI00055BF606|nr:hypothetical protein [Massilia sp. 9096]
MPKQALLTLSAVLVLCACATLSIQARAADQEGMVVVKDAVTGKMRAPTPEEMRALRAATPGGAPDAAMGAARPSAAASLSRSDGARGVRIGESRMVYEVVTRGPDGKLSSQCVQGLDAAERAR